MFTCVVHVSNVLSLHNFKDPMSVAAGGTETYHEQALNFIEWQISTISCQIFVDRSRGFDSKVGNNLPFPIRIDRRH